MQDPGSDHHRDQRVLLVPSRYASGFMLPTNESPLGGPTSFGHPGRGGSLGFADPDSGGRPGARAGTGLVSTAPSPMS